MTGWTAVLDLVRGTFTAPGFACFTDLLTGWVLSPGRRTITRMLTVGDPEARRAHDAYHRLVRAGAWSMSWLWRALAVHIVAVLVPAGEVTVDCDDTLFHRDGPRVEGAGVFRDAVRSTVRKVVYARGLNLVVLSVRVRPPWGGCPLGLPVNMRLHRKGGPTTVALAAQMMTELATWLPERQFALCADGAYASLAGAGLPRTSVTSRLRRDAALFQAAPPRTGRRGRPAKKGARLPTPPQLAAAATDWTAVDVDERGRTVRRLLWSREVLWYTVEPDRMLRLVIVRDPTGTQPDDFFITTDTTASDADIASRYAGHWSIEVAFRDTKQHLGGQQPQSWRGAGPERAAVDAEVRRTPPFSNRELPGFRGWRDLKGAPGVRPAFHYREDRIRSHVQLCWLALLLLHLVENATNDTWRNVRHELDRMHLITLATADGRVAQRSATTTGHKTILAARPSRTPTVLRLHRTQRLTPTAAGPAPVVTRPPHARPAFPQVNAQIPALVCSSSAEVRPVVTSPKKERT